MTYDELRYACERAEAEGEYVTLRNGCHYHVIVIINSAVHAYPLDSSEQPQTITQDSFHSNGWHMAVPADVSREFFEAGGPICHA